MLDVIAKNADAITAVATTAGTIVAIIMCSVTICNVRDTARTVASAMDAWKQVQNPSFCIERRGRLADDGKNFCHEDLVVSNLGRAPKSIKGITVKEYHVVTVTKGLELKTLVLPIWFYQYGSYSQQLVGRIFKAVGDNARERCFDFDVKMRTFLKSKGWGYCSATKVIARISFVDVFGDGQDEYFDVDSVGGHEVIAREKFEDYDKKARLLFKLSPVKLELSKIDPNKFLRQWIVPDVPQKILSPDEMGDCLSGTSTAKEAP